VRNYPFGDLNSEVIFSIFLDLKVPESACHCVGPAGSTIEEHETGASIFEVEM
jgi:hypothetical protein